VPVVPKARSAPPTQSAQPSSVGNIAPRKIDEYFERRQVTRASSHVSRSDAMVRSHGSMLKPNQRPKPLFPPLTLLQNSSTISQASCQPAP
jgi:hypothetical protein